MSDTSVTFDIPETSLATLDEIASNMETDRATVLRDAIAFYLADYEQEKAGIEEAERQIDAGHFTTQEAMEARLEARFRRTEAA